MRVRMKPCAANIPALEHIFELKTPLVRRKAAGAVSKIPKIPKTAWNFAV
jgi:hypothetical protein